jgi:shikimate dehydrogenase
MRISGTTPTYALLGNPVAHSLSPAMQNAAFRALGLDAVYVALRCEAGELPALIDTLVRQGGGGNVTIPHKGVAAEHVARRGAPVGPICNTFWGEGGRLAGADTDSPAIARVAARLNGMNGAHPSGWLVIGTGGSARAALLAARDAGVPLTVRSRDPERARAFLAAARELAVVEAEPQACTLVLNCSPLGLDPHDPLPLDPRDAPRGAAALDLVYRPGETSWVRAMRAAGHPALDGREVLLEQGAAAFECWFPGRQAPREVMRAAVVAALG